MKIYKYILLCVTINTFSIAQTFDDPLKFFPAKNGDMWEYFYYDSPYTDTLQLYSVKDSVDEQGTIHLWQTSEFINPPMPPVLIGLNYYKIDTSGNVEGAWDSYRGILYKLNALQGDKWVLKAYSTTSYEMMIVDTVFESTLFGINTLIKRYKQYFSNDSTASTGSDIIAKYLGYNLGIVQVDGLEGLGFLYLRGAVINSILYGDTTQIITSIFDDRLNHSLNDFIIFQNFPNPFNPSTTIRYQILQDGIVTLKVYDILGSEVAILVNEQKVAGKYEVNFNASKLASGVYLYKLQAGDFVNTKKMILLK